MLRDYFSFSRSELRALTALVPILVVLVVLLALRKERQDHDLMAEDVTPTTQSSPNEPAPTILMPDSALFSFNPNTADSATLRSLGLSPRVASNIVKYRKAGGTFRKSEDLARIYGMDSATFAILKPYICIPKPEVNESHRVSPAPVPNTPSTSIIAEDSFVIATPKQENPYREYMANKLHEGEFLDINRADTADLKRIPGIGSYYASAIVSYRRRLGGFVSLSQLQELSEFYNIDHLPENLGDWLTLEPGSIQPININKATLKQLKEHPYIGYYRAKAIVDLRKSEGRIINLRQLSFLDAFSDEDIVRLTPYLTF